jgi:hypothetical protein
MSTENEETPYINNGLSQEEHAENLNDSQIEAVSGGNRPVYAKLTRTLSAPSSMHAEDVLFDKQFGQKIMSHYDDIKKPMHPLK